MNEFATLLARATAPVRHHLLRRQESAVAMTIALREREVVDLQTAELLRSDGGTFGQSARHRSTPSQDTQRTAGVRSETGTPLSILPCVQFQPQRVHRASRQWSRPVVPMPFVRARVGGRFTGTRGPVGAPLPPAAVMSDTAITCGSGEIIDPESPGSL